MRSGWLLGLAALALAAVLGWEALRAPLPEPAAREAAPPRGDTDPLAPEPESGPGPSPEPPPNATPDVAPAVGVDRVPALPALKPRDPMPPPWLSPALLADDGPIAAPAPAPSPKPEASSGPRIQRDTPPARPPSLAEMLSLEIRADKTTLGQGEDLALRARLRNVGSRDLAIMKPVLGPLCGLRHVRYFLRVEDERGRDRVLGHICHGPYPGEAGAYDDIVTLRPGEVFDCDPRWLEDRAVMHRPGTYLLSATYTVTGSADASTAQWQREALGTRAARTGRTIEQVTAQLERVDVGSVRSNVLIVTRLP